MNPKTLRSLFVLFFAVLISVSCLASIPYGSVYATVQDMIVLLASCIMGSIQGASSAGIFLAAGALGLPVYPCGRGGVANLISPSGGFLIGYFLGAIAAGVIAGKPSADEKKLSLSGILRLTAAFIAGDAVIFLTGTLWFMHALQISFAESLASCVIPFIPRESLKMIATVLISCILRPCAARYLYPAD
jgi:biotin transport system substrate-specific component